MLGPFRGEGGEKEKHLCRVATGTKEDHKVGRRRIQTECALRGCIGGSSRGRKYVEKTELEQCQLEDPTERWTAYCCECKKGKERQQNEGKHCGAECAWS